MYRNYFFFITFFLLFFTACAQNKNDSDPDLLEFYKVSSLSFPLASEDKTVLYSAQVVVSGQDTILIANFQDYKLTLYNFSTRSIIKQVPLRKEFLVSFNYKNKDSIFVLYEPAHRINYYHDSIFFRINDDGKILDNYSFEKTPAICEKKKNFENNTDSIYYTYLYFNPLIIYNQNAYFIFAKYSFKYIGDSAFNSFKYPISGHIDLKEANYFPHKGLKYPYIKKGVYYPRSFANMVYYCLNESRNRIVYGFAYTADIFSYNPADNKFEKHRIQSSVYDSIYPEKEPYRNQYNFEKPRYKQLHYNNSTGEYLRFLELPQIEYGKRKVVFSLADDDFETLGEGVYPEDASSSKIFGLNKKWYIQNYKKRDALVLDIYDIRKKEGINRSLAAEVQNFKVAGDSLSYAEFLSKCNSAQADTFMVLSLPYSHGCPSCIQTGIDFFGANIKTLKESNVYLMVSAPEDALILQALKKQDILPDGETVFLDSEEKYLRYKKNSSLFNPNISIIGSGKILYDKTYKPSEMLEMQKNIQDFVKKEQSDD